MWITVNALVERLDEELDMKGIELSDPELIWAHKAIRSELIEDFNEIEEGKIVIYFMNNKPPLFIKEDYNEFFDRVKDLDYVKFDLIPIRDDSFSNKDNEENS